MKDSTGVAVLAVACLVLALVQAFFAAAAGAAGNTSVAGVGGLYATAFAFTGVALWRRRESGRRGAIAISCLQILKSFVAAAGLAAGLRETTGMRVTPGEGLGILATLGVLFGVPVAVLIYLNRPGVKSLFAGR